MAEEAPLSASFVIEHLRTPKEVTAELGKLSAKKQATEEKLASLERQIYALEGSYLHDTRNLGNILVGWDSYLNARSGALKRPQKYKDSDRLFSLSSVSSLKFTEIGDKRESNDNGDEEEEVIPRQPNKIQKTTSKKQGRPRKRPFGEDDEFLEV